MINVILGHAMQNVPGVAARLFGAAAAVGVNIVAIAQPGSEVSVSVVVAAQDATRCMEAFHRSWSNNRRRINVVLIGSTGVVGREVLQILETRNQAWRDTIDTDVQLACTCTSKTMSFRNAMNGSVTELPMSFPALLEQLRARHLENLHIVDVTASADIGAFYSALLELGVLVVANKRASSGPLDVYDKLAPHCFTRRYRYEATVMAGLPVMSTLQSLLVSGDQIHSVSGVFSGTLSFIFNSMAAGVPFKDAGTVPFARSPSSQVSHA